MKTLSVVLFSVGIMLLFFFCSENTVDPDKNNDHKLYQIAGCQNDQLPDLFLNDSCFSYLFSNDLFIDFCVTANCCPDSNRFDLSHDINNDIIALTVIDTAAQLCFCECTYVVHAEFFDLPLDHYTFICTYNDSIIYNEEIWRIFNYGLETMSVE